MSDAPDFTDQYNTPLSIGEEIAFKKWVKDNKRDGDLADYDLRGAWKSNAKSATNGHLPDTWKKPNHPTFSQESQYSNETNQGGKWIGSDKKGWAYWASPSNLNNMGAKGLSDYFSRVEPDNAVVLPISLVGKNGR